MSRRDEALSAVDELVGLFRSGLTQALDADHNRTAPRNPRRSSDAPPPPAAGPSSTPFSTGASHQSFPLDPQQPQPPGDGDDELPGYSRRAPVDPRLTADLPPKRRHVLASKTGKLRLDLDARGKDHVILVQEQPDSDVTLAGTLTVHLRDPEAITHVRVRLKGMVRTLAQKAHASGRHPVSDEVDFFEDGHDLWTAPPLGAHNERLLAGNTTNEPSKLQGTFSFPFSVTLPGRLTRVPRMDLPPGRAMRPPPSFVLDSAVAQLPSSGTTSILTTGVGAFEASCRYYLKVTLGRRGLLKLNERWVVPVVFVPRQAPPVSPSPQRALALAHGRTPPSSASDPEGWTDARKYVARAGSSAARRGGLFKSGARGAWVEVEGKVPKPHKFVKGQGQAIDFEVHITSDANSGRFPASAVAVSLLQRTVVHAQNLVNTLDTVVLRAQAVRPIGAPDGLPVRLDNGVQAWRVTYGGSVTLTQGMTASFRAPNLQVLYELAITLYQPGSKPGSTTHTQIASLAIPVEIVSCVPAVGSAAQDERPPPPHSAPAPAAEAAPLPPHEQPPSSASTFAPPPNPPPPPAPSHAAPSLPPRQPSSFAQQPGHSAPPPRPPQQQQQQAAAAADEERRLEDEFGLPPSYFDVVAEEARR
ncbi:hypothetical protein JCM3775_006858 [Rhodotorula graminis]|uniref:Arrestin-like N-terminal domain-containing protein n=1 Tax=Rhodotorula graminis (strain WP1) TaxID=578459 RepID=A0A194SE97_RHOGW|nr:uncharacterized protein RHOBADRAFT_41804 [Rhodotorula graminis WP1]KPV77806.1 hypothetical protein RHOBADRAFT_41804 [Rhodotorula graminis WP1]